MKQYQSLYLDFVHFAEDENSGVWYIRRSEESYWTVHNEISAIQHARSYMLGQPEASSTANMIPSQIHWA